MRGRKLTRRAIIFIEKKIDAGGHEMKMKRINHGFFKRAELRPIRASARYNKKNLLKKRFIRYNQR